MSAYIGFLPEKLEVYRHSFVVDDETGCWKWLMGRTKKGYGTLNIYQGIRGAGRQTAMAHRYFYTHIVGPIQAGLQIDHLCRVRYCVNPAHMEQVTNRTNTIRGNKSKFPKEVIDKIREEYNETKDLYRSTYDAAEKLSMRYNMSLIHMYNVLNKRSRKEE